MEKSKDKKKLLFDITKLYKTDDRGFYRSGIFWVTYNLLSMFLKDERFDVTLYSEYAFPKGNFDTVDIDISFNEYVFQKYSINIGKIKKNILNKNFQASLYDAYFNSAFFSKLDYSDIKQFYLLHDAIPMILKDKYPESFISNFKEFYDGLSSEAFCFCISKSCKDDFIKYFPQLDSKKMEIVYNASSQNFIPMKNELLREEIITKYNLPLGKEDKYIFTISNLADAKKNLQFTLEAFFKFIEKYQVDDLFFILAGYGKDILISDLKKNCSVLYEKYKNRIFFLGYLEDCDVNVFYSNALYFSFLSLYEGFGLPLLEAMQAAVPVLTSNTSSIPEVVEDAAVMLSPKDMEECIEKMHLLYSDKNLCKSLVEKGIVQAKKFSWEKTYKLISDKIYAS